MGTGTWVQVHGYRYMGTGTWVQVHMGTSTWDVQVEGYWTLIHLSLQAVEIGGYLHECGCMKAVDKKLDSDPVGNHRFLQQRENLVKQKMENPALKMTKSLRESINVEEEVVTGLKGPKKRFLELSAYERKFGPAPEDQIKQQVYNGQTLLGVDVIDEDDVGVYEYIDQNITKVARVTAMNSDVQLSAEQNDVIHASALKTLKQSTFATSDKSAIPVRFHSGASDAVELASEGEKGKGHGAGGEEECHADDDDADLDPQPFQGLLHRMLKEKKRSAPASSATQPPKRTKPASTPSTAETTAAPSVPNNGGGGGTGGGGGKPNRKGTTKRETPAKVDEGDQTESKRSKDDQAVIDGYIAQLIPLLKLDAEKSDDSGFAPWQKDKTKNLNELKSSILTKKKSLKRRTAADASALTDELDKIVADVNAHIGLLKQLSLGTLEGSNTYDNIKCLVKEKGDDIIQVSFAVWQRALRGVAFEDSTYFNSMFNSIHIYI